LETGTDFEFVVWDVLAAKVFEFREEKKNRSETSGIKKRTIWTVRTVR